jgi:hypothetical protein
MSYKSLKLRSGETKKALKFYVAMKNGENLERETAVGDESLAELLKGQV